MRLVADHGRVLDMDPVVVVGAGIAGIACARELAGAAVPVRVLDRGRRIGGRMAVRTLAGRPIDIGASYFTVRDDAFRAVVDDWCARGLARPWTDTFHLGSPEGLDGTTTGPIRYAAPAGLRSLVEDHAAGLDVRHPVDVEGVARTAAGPEVDGARAPAVVLAMPDPQAADLLSDELSEERAAVEEQPWQPCLSLWARWERRCWPDVDGVFVSDSPVLAWLADDGRRRGDDAPVLVAHSTAPFAAGRLDEPHTGREPMLAEIARLLDVPVPPLLADVKRWSLSAPREKREASYFLGEAGVGLCGDGWRSPSRVEAAYLSGRALGQALVERLA